MACVIFGVLAPGEALAAVDTATILLLFGVMGMGAFLALDGFFDDLEAGLTALARTPARLLGLIVWAGGILAAFITNDAVCVLGAPLVVRLIQRHRLPPLPFLLALATAANTGSVATLVGNPQNMLCATIGGLEYRRAPACCSARWRLRRSGGEPRPVALGLPAGPARAPPFAAGAPAPPPRLRRSSLMTLGVIGATAVAYTLGAEPRLVGDGRLRRPHAAAPPRHAAALEPHRLVVAALLLRALRGGRGPGAQRPACGGLRALSAGLDSADGFADLLHLAGVFLIGSNVVSNVPFILVVREQMATLPDPRLAWELLAMASTFAGNLTLLGSVANIIVAESARDDRRHQLLGLPEGRIAAGAGDDGDGDGVAVARAIVPTDPQ